MLFPEIVKNDEEEGTGATFYLLDKQVLRLLGIIWNLTSPFCTNKFSIDCKKIQWQCKRNILIAKCWLDMCKKNFECQAHVSRCVLQYNSLAKYFLTLKLYSWRSTISCVSKQLIIASDIYKHNNATRGISSATKLRLTSTYWRMSQQYQPCCDWQNEPLW